LAKGKIERLFRTVRDRFLTPLSCGTLPEDLDALNRAFRSWTETYHRTVHSAHRSTPLDRWLAGASRLRTIAPDELERCFLFEVTRTIRKDGTFSIDGRRFETDWTLSGRRLPVRFRPFDFTRVEVLVDGVPRAAVPLDPQANVRRPRHRPNPER